MSHQSKYETCPENPCDNNNTIIKDPLDTHKHLSIKITINHDKDFQSRQEMEPANEKMQSALQIQDNVLDCNKNTTANNLNSKNDRFDAASVSESDSNDSGKESHSNQVFSGLKQAVDAIRGKLSSLRLSRHSNSSQTSSIGEADNVDCIWTSVSSNNETHGEVEHQITIEKPPNNNDMRENENNNEKTFEIQSTYFKRKSESGNESNETENQLIISTKTLKETQTGLGNDHYVLSSKLSDEVFKTDSNKTSLINSEKQYKDVELGPIHYSKVDSAVEESPRDNHSVEILDLESPMHLQSNIKQLVDKQTAFDQPQNFEGSALNDSEHFDDTRNTVKTAKCLEMATNESKNSNSNSPTKKTEMNSVEPFKPTEENTENELVDPSGETSLNDASQCPLCQEIYKNSQSEDDKRNQRLKEDKSVCLEDIQYGVKLWQVRNDMEDATIEIRCHMSKPAGHNNGECRKHPLSITTDGMTEASPLSTPSSSRPVSMEKSMSDLDSDHDFEGKGYYVTDSGRLSPLPPCSCKTEGVTDLSKDNAGQDDFDIQNMCLCKDQEVSTTYASNFSQRNEEIFQPNLENDNLNESKLRDKTFTLGSVSDSLGEVERVNSLDSTESDYIQTSPTRYQTASHSSTSKAAKPDKKATLFSLWNKKKRPAEMARRVSLPVISAGPDPQTLSNRFIPSFMRSSSTTEKKRAFDSKPNKGTRTLIKRNNQKTSSVLKVRSSYSKKDSVSSDEVFETARSSITTGSNVSLSQDYEIASRRSDGDLNTRIATSENKLKFLEPFPRTKRAKSLIPMSSDHNLLQQKGIRRHKKGRSNKRNCRDTIGATLRYSLPTNKRNLSLSKSIDESDDSTTSFPVSRSGPRPSIVARLIQRGQYTLKRNRSVPTFCGYTMERDYCVDGETDRIFKEFLFNDKPTIILSPTEENAPSTSHDLPTQASGKGTLAAQLQREVIKKQYSDSVATYVGQSQRRMRFAQQVSDIIIIPRSDSLNFSFEQDPIEEELDGSSPTLSHRSTSTRIYSSDNEKKRKKRNGTRKSQSNSESRRTTSSAESDSTSSKKHRRKT